MMCFFTKKFPSLPFKPLHSSVFPGHACLYDFCRVSGYHSIRLFDSSVNQTSCSNDNIICKDGSLKYQTLKSYPAMPAYNDVLIGIRLLSVDYDFVIVRGVHFNAIGEHTLFADDYFPSSARIEQRPLPFACIHYCVPANDQFVLPGIGIDSDAGKLAVIANNHSISRTMNLEAAMS